MVTDSAELQLKFIGRRDGRISIDFDRSPSPSFLTPQTHPNRLLRTQFAMAFHTGPLVGDFGKRRSRVTGGVAFLAIRFQGPRCVHQYGARVCPFGCNRRCVTISLEPMLRHFRQEFLVIEFQFRVPRRDHVVVHVPLGHADSRRGAVMTADAGFGPDAGHVQIDKSRGQCARLEVLDFQSHNWPFVIPRRIIPRRVRPLPVGRVAVAGLAAHAFLP